MDRKKEVDFMLGKYLDDQYKEVECPKARKSHLNKNKPTSEEDEISEWLDATEPHRLNYCAECKKQIPKYQKQCANCRAVEDESRKAAREKKLKEKNDDAEARRNSRIRNSKPSFLSQHPVAAILFIVMILSVVIAGSRNDSNQPTTIAEEMPKGVSDYIDKRLRTELPHLNKGKREEASKAIWNASK